MQIVKLHLDHYNFYCPVTGQRILDEETFNKSPALRFAYVDVGDFEFADEEIKNLFDEYKKLHGEDKDSLDLFEEFVENTTLVDVIVFQITHSGIACGPASTTVWFAIDMNYDEDDQSHIN